jgi:hypothetical protein
MLPTFFASVSGASGIPAGRSSLAVLGFAARTAKLSAIDIIGSSDIACDLRGFPQSGSSMYFWIAQFRGGHRI